jgi:hypothetical protein
VALVRRRESTSGVVVAAVAREFQARVAASG